MTKIFVSTSICR